MSLGNTTRGFLTGFMNVFWLIQDVDYDATMSVKLSVAKKVFKLEKDEVLESVEYKRFFKENQV